MQSVSRALVVPRDSHLGVRFEHAPPALVGEVYDIAIVIANEEACAISELRLLVSAEAAVEFSSDASMRPEKTPLALPLPPTLEPGGVATARLWLRASQPDIKAVAVRISYSLTGERPVVCVMNDSVTLPIVQPFEVSAQYLSGMMQRVSKFYAGERFAVMPLVRFLSPWPISVEGTALEFTHPVRALEDAQSHLAGSVFNQDEVGTEVVLAVCDRQADQNLVVGEYAVTWQRWGQWQADNDAGDVARAPLRLDPAHVGAAGARARPGAHAHDHPVPADQSVVASGAPRRRHGGERSLHVRRLSADRGGGVAVQHENAALQPLPAVGGQRGAAPPGAQPAAAWQRRPRPAARPAGAAHRAHDPLQHLRHVGVDEQVELVRQIVGLVAQHLRLAAGAVQRCHLALEQLELVVHVGGGLVDQTAQARKGAAQLLLHLVAAVGRRQVDDHAQLARGVRHVLALERALLRLVGPGEALVQVETAVEGAGDGDDAPTDRFEHEAGHQQTAHGALGGGAHDGDARYQRPIVEPDVAVERAPVQRLDGRGRQQRALRALLLGVLQAQEGAGAAAAGEALEQRHHAVGEPELQVLVEVGAQIVAVEPIEDLEGLAARHHDVGGAAVGVRQERLHFGGHLRLALLHVHGQRGREAGAQVGAQPGLHVEVQLLLVDVEHERLGVEGQAELVHQRAQPPDLLGQRLGDALLHVLDHVADLLLHLLRDQHELLLRVVHLVDQRLALAQLQLLEAQRLADLRGDVLAALRVLLELGPHRRLGDALLELTLKVLGRRQELAQVPGGPRARNTHLLLLVAVLAPKERRLAQDETGGLRPTHLVEELRLRSGRVPAVVQDEDVRFGQLLGHLVEEVLLGQHEGGLGVRHQDEHVGVQTVHVDPLVKVGGDVDARRVHEDDVVPQQQAAVLRPEDAHQLRLAQLLLAEGVGQLAHRLHRPLLIGALQRQVGVSRGGAFHLEIAQLRPGSFAHP
ncbi:hypothetical protein YQE_08444, partial [Dendroctonus ponderosae]